MAIDDNPITVFNRQLENEELSKPLGANLITHAAKVVDGISQLPPLRPLGLVAKGLEITGKCLSIGVPTVEENLKLFGKLVEDRLIVLETRVDNAEEFQRRIESEEFMQCLASGVLQTQRTTQENRIRRMATILANGVREGDLEPENFDDMMRAAVELTEHDVNVLSSIYEMQLHLFSPREIEKEYSWRIDEIHSLWEKQWRNRPRSSYQGINGMNLNGSFARLQSAGLIVSIGTTSILYGPTMHDYELLPAGKKFYEHLQEVAVSE